MKRLYEPLYRFVKFFRVPISWVFGSKPDLERLVESGRIKQGRTIDLGCGTGLEAIYLAKNGFNVTGVDFSPTAIKMARKNAEVEGVHVDFIQDDLTDLSSIDGTFDFLVDYGAMNDLNQPDRDLYVMNVLPLCHPGSQFLLMCSEKNLPLSEIETRFADSFSIELISKESENLFGRTMTVYLLTRLAMA